MDFRQETLRSCSCHVHSAREKQTKQAQFWPHFGAFASAHDSAAPLASEAINMARELKNLSDALVAGLKDASASTVGGVMQAGRASRSRAEVVETVVELEEVVVEQKPKKAAPKRKQAARQASEESAVVLPAAKASKAANGKRKKRAPLDAVKLEAAEDADEAAADAVVAAPAEDAVEQAVAALAPAPSGPAARGSNLREAQARVARDRAAHFARADKADKEPARSSSSSSSSKPGKDEEWCGPFATARRLLNERAAAAAARQLRLDNGTIEEDESADEGDRDAPPAVKKVVVQWTGTGSGSLIGRTFSVPPLFQLCLQMLCANFDCVEDLGDVTAEVRNRLAALLCRQLKLTPEVLERIAGPGVTEVVLPDCSRIDAEQMLVSRRCTHMLLLQLYL
jgi:hypothetical protein